MHEGYFYFTNTQSRYSKSYVIVAHLSWTLNLRRHGGNRRFHMAHGNIRMNVMCMWLSILNYLHFVTFLTEHGTRIKSLLIFVYNIFKNVSVTIHLLLFIFYREMEETVNYDIFFWFLLFYPEAQLQLHFDMLIPPLNGIFCCFVENMDNTCFTQARA